MAHTFADDQRPDYNFAPAVSRPFRIESPGVRAGDASGRAPSGRIASRSLSAGESPPHERGPLAIAREVPHDLAGKRLDRVLAHLLPEHSRSRLAGWVRAGRVTVDGALWSADRRVHGGERLVVTVEADRACAAHAPEAIPLAVVYEDDDLLVIDKPAGLVVHPGSGNWQGTLLNALLAHAPALCALPRAGIVHRLDKDTTGLLVVAKTQAAQTALVRQLQARIVKREYLALVHGDVPAAGRIEGAIGRHPTARTRMALVARGKPAVTRYRVARRFAQATLLECALETGRTHQIRVHLASIGRPLVGDPVYGRKRARDAALAGFRRQALHAARLGLEHPRTGASVQWESPLPGDFAALLASLGRSG
jgi:23S rRNA pseudouridine1911/1915/1917 synthase